MATPQLLLDAPLEAGVELHSSVFRPLAGSTSSSLVVAATIDVSADIEVDVGGAFGWRAVATVAIPGSGATVVALDLGLPHRLRLTAETAGAVRVIGSYLGAP
jgi:hypothetical protein